MTDTEIKRCADLLSQINYHKSEIIDHEQRIALHEIEITKARAEIDGLNADPLYRVAALESELRETKRALERYTICTHDRVCDCR